jgi:hypothetical protein
MRVLGEALERWIAGWQVAENAALLATLRFIFNFKSI